MAEVSDASQLDRLTALLRQASGPEASEPEVETLGRLARMALLSAGVAQDLEGPIGYMLANLEYLQCQLESHDGGLTEDLAPGRASELRRCVREAMIGAGRVREIVRDLRMVPAPSESSTDVDLHRVLLSCIKVARTEIDHRARVITEFDAVPTLSCSEARVSRLFLNLILNAAQAVAGDAENEHFIRVSTRTEPGRRVLVEIADSGPGIPPDHLPRIFDPFFTTKPAGQGTGLGLAICRQITEDLGGTLTVLSTPGRGAAFRVTLPTRAGGLAAAADERDRGSSPFTPSRPPVRRLPLRQLG